MTALRSHFRPDPYPLYQVSFTTVQEWVSPHSVANGAGAGANLSQVGSWGWREKEPYFSTVGDSATATGACSQGDECRCPAAPRISVCWQGEGEPECLSRWDFLFGEGGVEQVLVQVPQTLNVLTESRSSSSVNISSIPTSRD